MSLRGQLRRYFDQVTPGLQAHIPANQAAGN